jgi:hypothetical protein
MADPHKGGQRFVIHCQDFLCCFLCIVKTFMLFFMHCQDFLCCLLCILKTFSLCCLL